MNILRLIAKDVRLQRSFVLPLILLEAAGYFTYAVQMPSRMPGVAFGLLHGIALVGDFLICYRTMIAEEKNRALMFIRTLPVSVPEIVTAKFATNALLDGLNTGFLLAVWGICRGFGWIQVRPSLTVYLVVSGITLHWLNNAFFLAISLLSGSERAVWAPFPAIFVVMTAILNFRRIETALHLEPFVAALGEHRLLWLGLLWAAIVGSAAMCSWGLRRKRIFA
jgi:hypothetical protein